MKRIFTFLFLPISFFAFSQSSISTPIGNNSTVCKTGMNTSLPIGANITDDGTGIALADTEYTFSSANLDVSPATGTVTNLMSEFVITNVTVPGGTNPGTYMVTLQTMQAGTTTIDDTETYTIIVNDIAEVTIATPDGTEICSDGSNSINLNGSVQTNVTGNFEWSTAGTPTTPSISVSDITGMTETITLTVSNTCGMSSSSVLITENEPASIMTQPMDIEDCESNTVTFSIATTGGITPSYQWQRSTAGSFSDIGGATNPSLTVVAGDANNPDGADYQVIVNVAGCAEQTSNIAELSLTPPVDIVGTLNTFSLNPGVSINIDRTIVNVDPASTTVFWTVHNTNISSTTSTSVMMDMSGNTATANVSFSTPNSNTIIASLELTNDANVEITNINLQLTAMQPCTTEVQTTNFSLLPVELLYFRGAPEAENVMLNWATATEEQNDFFSIERSFDGYTFEEIGKVEGAGDSYSTLTYSFLDKEVERLAPSNNVYYRLKQTDFDGNSSLSEIVNIELDKVADLEVVQVLQDVEFLDLHFYSPDNEEVMISVFNLNGLKISNQQFLSFEGINQVQISTSLFPEGIYVLHLDNGRKRISKKFTKFF